jgi:hypothetical protein
MVRCFPKLKQHRFEITSQFDEGYNCIACAAEDAAFRWWWPSAWGDTYWPPGVRQRETVETFVLAFGTLGYERCGDGSLEPGLQKVAIYADARGVPTRAARQLADGAWIGKLGKCEDIRHDEAGALEDSTYGKVAVFFRSPVG